MKEELINKIVERTRFLCEKCSIKELEKYLKDMEKTIKQIEKIEELLKDLDD